MLFPAETWCLDCIFTLIHIYIAVWNHCPLQSPHETKGDGDLGLAEINISQLSEHCVNTI